MPEITVTLKDGFKKRIAAGTTALQAAASLGFKDAVVAKVNGELKDLSTRLDGDCSLELLDFSSDEGKDTFRHSSAHVLAAAVKELFPDAKLAIGPAVEDGFYYDFDRKQAFTPSDLEKIEAKMKEIVERNEPFEKIVVSKEEARKIVEKIDGRYKAEILGELEVEISFYKNGSFIDLCRGPHVPSTSCIKAFKLTEVAAAYWRGLATNPMLQRIYGISFPTQGELEDYLRRVEEVKRRDHRKLGKELDLFSVHEMAGAGLIFYHPRSAILRGVLEDWEKKELQERGYLPVITPHLFRVDTWHTSGHIQYYKDLMYLFECDGEQYGIKPMNCPGHIIIYKTKSRSYRDLPIRYAEFGTVYRKEMSGVVGGLFRVRGFTQDDAHIFCTPEQLKDELKGCLEFALHVLRTFGFDYEAFLSTRPEKSLGTNEEWEHATKALEDAAKEVGMNYKLDPGAGVFYGPKIDVKMKDAVGRKWQGPTIQVDFNLPEKFDVAYVAQDGKEHRAVMVHRALFGSFERFLGVLIEHYAGAFPVWLSPVQVALLPLNDQFNSFARELEKRFSEAGIRTWVDDRTNTVQYKVREAHFQKYPYILVVGKKEKESGALMVRKRSGEVVGPIKIEDFISQIKQEIDGKK